YEAVFQTLQSNLKKPDSKTPFYHVRPAPKFDGVYLWDSAFIALIWMHKNPQTAEQVILSVLHGQQPDGRIPHVINVFGTSEWTQPPVLSWATAKIASHSENLDFIRASYDKLVKYHSWLMSSRRLSNGLFYWEHAYESGIDNTPRFGTRDESKYIDTKLVAAVDLSSYMVMDARALAKLAGMQGLTEDAARFEKEADEISALIRQHLWDETTGYFYDLDTVTGQMIAIPTIASFFPMAAKAATPEQAARLVTHIENPAEFGTQIPFPTVARNHPTFEKDCWRGPVWINTAYLGIQGLKEYGYGDLAKQTSYRLVDGVYKTWNNTRKFVEYYDPERFDFDKLTRKKGIGFLDFFSGSKSFKKFLEHLFLKQIYLGTKPVDGFVGWTGLVNNLVVEELDEPNQPNQ
ncbi:MAG TPA: trehalase family glycosidase, partial [Bdellovibrionales bacterium]|nr:trehalase family glycosidase [Bdellovibrionales bacterium]